jgi:hypothetical protein
MPGNGKHFANCWPRIFLHGERVYLAILQERIHMLQYCGVSRGLTSSYTIRGSQNIRSVIPAHTYDSVLEGLIKVEAFIYVNSGKWTDLSGAMEGTSSNCDEIRHKGIWKNSVLHNELILAVMRFSF